MSRPIKRGVVLSAIVAGVWVPRGFSQTQVDLRTQAKSVDFSNAVSTKPMQAGTVLPATCTVGQMFFNSSVAAGSNLYACTSTNTWSLETGGGGSGGGASLITTPFSATPGFTCPVGAAVTSFRLSTALTANISGSTLSSCTAGQVINFLFTQDGTGGRTVSMPAGFSSACQVSPIANATTTISFFWDGTNADLISCVAFAGPSVVLEQAAPTNSPAAGLEFAWSDSTGLLPRWRNSSGTIFQASKELNSGNIRKAGGTNAPDAAAAASDVVGLFSSCSGTEYLGADGECHASSFAVSLSRTSISTGSGDTTLFSVSGVPPLAAGACYVINYSILAGASYTSKLYIDGSAVETLGTTGATNEVDTHTLMYCNQSGSQMAQYLTEVQGSYCGSGCPSGQYSNFYLLGGQSVTPAAVNWTNSHALSLTVSTSSSGISIVGQAFRIGQ